MKASGMNETNARKMLTNRLELIAANWDHVCAELEAPEHLAALLKATVEPGWPPGEYDRDAQIFFRDRLREGGLSVTGWYGWYALRRVNPDEPSVLVGAAGYIGPPDGAGAVEIGFSLMPAWQGLGYATEICRALVENALADARVKKVVAHAAPVNLASCRELEKCGFRGADIDEETGNKRFEILRGKIPGV